jgi:hypothetical protein
MPEDRISVGDFHLSTEPIHSTGAWRVRELDRVVDGKVRIYNATGPRDLIMEIHYIELDSGHRWVVGGEAFNGPKWVFGQLNNRLRISVIEKSEGFVFDLTIPKPSRRKKEVYTASKSTVEELSETCKDMFTMLHNHGARAIGIRADTIGDTSSRRGFMNVVLDSPDCLAPVLAYFLTRTVAMSQEYETLLLAGQVDEETVSHYAEHSTKNSPPKSDDAASMIAGGESAFVEFKPAVWFDKRRSDNEPNYRTNKSTTRVKNKIIRTVAGFLNAEGGTLFIGVSDDGNAYGIQTDVELTGRGDLDGYELELFSLLTNSISTDMVARKVRVSFPKFQGVSICRVEVTRSNEPVFANTMRVRDAFFVRIGNSTQTMSVQSAMSYVKNHDWGDSDSE